MARFFGKFPRSVDDKGRVIIPANFRDALGDDFYIVQGAKKQLAVYTLDDWDQYFEQYANDDEDDEAAVYAELDKADVVTTGKCDAQGRLCVPPEYRKFAGISENEEVIVIGIKNRIEIWNTENYEEVLKKAREMKSAKREQAEKDGV